MHAKSCKYLYDMNMIISIKLYIYHSNIFVLKYVSGGEAISLHPSGHISHVLCLFLHFLWCFIVFQNVASFNKHLFSFMQFKF